MNKLAYEYHRQRSKFAKNPPKHLSENASNDSDVLVNAVTGGVDIKPDPTYDISKWEVVTDWVGLTPKPVLVILRATYGAYYVDPTYASYVRASRLALYPTWAYHFLLYTQGWAAQADSFLRTVKASGITPDFRPILDIEGYLPSGMSRATANGMIENFLYKVESELGRSCHIYSSRNYLSQLYDYTPPLWLTKSSRLKWIAGFPYDPNIYSDMPVRYRPVGLAEDPALWQYSEKARVLGITGAVDVSDMSDWYEKVFAGGGSGC